MKIEIVDTNGSHWYTETDYESLASFEDDLKDYEAVRVRVRENSEGNWKVKTKQVVAYRLQD